MLIPCESDCFVWIENVRGNVTLAERNLTLEDTPIKVWRV